MQLRPQDMPGSPRPAMILSEPTLSSGAMCQHHGQTLFLTSRPFARSSIVRVTHFPHADRDFWTGETQEAAGEPINRSVQLFTYPSPVDPFDPWKSAQPTAETGRLVQTDRHLAGSNEMNE
jgi:hypothetical protein